MKKSVSFKTIGCRLNQFEIDALAGEFRDAGYQIHGPETPADVCIINTCTVTNQSDAKSRNAIRRSLKASPGALHVVTGCFAVHHREELENSDEITYVVDNEHKRHIFSLIHGHFNGEIIHPSNLPTELFEYRHSSAGFHTRSMIKIQDGCDNFCSYCIIPYVRGSAVSRSPEKVFADIRTALDIGAREIILTGVNISRYDYQKTSFTSLVKDILMLPGDFRLRISSMEPDAMDNSFYELFEHPAMCRHLHLCLQSGSNRILKAMNRVYTIDDYRRIVDRLRAFDPLFNITTDIMSGFPGESDSDHQATLQFCRETGFGHIHTFSFSPRSGTKPAEMPDQIPSLVKKTRSAEIIAIAAESKKKYRSQLIGMNQQVLIEQIKEGMLQGYGPYYAPFRIPFSAEKNPAVSGYKRNTIVTVEAENILENEDFALKGRIVADD